MGSEKIVGVLKEYVQQTRKFITYDRNIPIKGVSVDKCFIESRVTNLDKIKVPFRLIETGQFCYNKATDGKKSLPIALNDLGITFQIPRQCITFEIKKKELLNERFLNLLFKKEIIDTLAHYLSTGGILEELAWENFCRFPIVVPSLELQERIVSKYQVVSKYVEIKKQINELLERKMKAYFHILFDDLKEWEIKTFGELFSIIKGGRPPRSNKAQEEKYFCKSCGILWLQVSDITKSSFKFVNKTVDQLTEDGFKRGRCTLLGGGTFSLWTAHLEILLEKFSLQTIKWVLMFTGEPSSTIKRLAYLIYFSY